jgi:hypothetical protein
MNVEIGAEAALFPEKEYINGIALAVQVARPAWLFYRAKTFLENNQSSNPQQSINIKKLLARGLVFYAPPPNIPLQVLRQNVASHNIYVT